MKPIPGYESAPAYTGEAMQLPPGLYICIVKQVSMQNDRNGREQMAILYDIAEGEFKEFYKKQFDARKKNNSSDAKWGGVHKQHTYTNNGQTANPFFKGMICSIEKSNNGYRWDWNEKGLVGKRFGGIFGREEFLTESGEKRMSTKLLQIRSIEGLKDAKVPEDKLLPEGQAVSPNTALPAPDMDGFMNIPDEIDEELPFM